MQLRQLSSWLPERTQLSHIDKTDEILPGLSGIPRSNASSIGGAHQSGVILSNNIKIPTNDAAIGNYNNSLDQRVSAGSNIARNQTGGDGIPDSSSGASSQ